MRYRLLGNLAVERDDGTPVEIPAPKRRALLAILLLQRGRPITRERLIELLWGDEPPDTAQASLFAHISRLRNDIGKERIQSVHAGYRLDVADEQFDVARFERDIDAGRRAHEARRWSEASDLLRAANEAWHGAALAEFAAEPFAQPEISRLEQLRDAALEDRIEADLALNRHASLVAELEQLVRLHPFRERLWGQLMLALYRSGRQSDALDRYQQLRRTLVNELGLEPSPELRDLQARILRQDAGLAAHPAATDRVVGASEAAPDRTVRADVSRSRPRPGSGFLAGVSVGWIASLTLIVVAIIIGAALVQGRGPFASIGPDGRATTPVTTPVTVIPTPQIVEEILFAASTPRDENLSCDAIETRLMHVSPDAGEPRRITSGGDIFEMTGTWSPDGSRVAFLGNVQDGTSLFAMKVDGTGVRDLLPTRPPAVIPGHDGRINWMLPLFRPAWSSDGTRIVFTYGQGGVWQVAPDGSDLTQLRADPSFNPDDASYAFRSSAGMPDGGFSVEVVVPDGSEPAPVRLFVGTADGSRFEALPGIHAGLVVEGHAWSSDGRLAFRGLTFATLDEPPATNLYVIDAPGDQARQVAGTEGVSGPPAWSPDASRIAFTAAGNLYTIDAAGGTRTPIVEDPGSTACGASWVRLDAAGLAHPAMSAAPGDTVPVLPFHRGFLDPGSYEATLFDPRIRFDVGSGWMGTRNAPDSLGLQYGWGTPDGYLGAITVGRVQVIFDSPCPWRQGQLIGPTAAEFTSYLQAHATDPGLETTDPAPVVFGGRTGLAIDVFGASAVTEEQCPGVPPPFRNMHPLFEVGGRDIVLRTGDRMRAISLDVGGGPAVTFLLIAPSQDFEDYTPVAPEAVEAFLDAAQPVVDSLTFE